MARRKKGGTFKFVAVVTAAALTAGVGGLARERADRMHTEDVAAAEVLAEWIQEDGTTYRLGSLAADQCRRIDLRTRQLTAAEQRVVRPNQPPAPVGYPVDKRQNTTAATVIGYRSSPDVHLAVGGIGPEPLAQSLGAQICALSDVSFRVVFEPGAAPQGSRLLVGNAG